MSHRSHGAVCRLSLVTALALSAFGCTGASESEDRSTNVSPEGAGELETNAVAAAGKRVIGYFTEWGVYGRNYHVKNIVTSGSASKLTHINYAFANVVGNRCQLGDTYSDYDKYYDAAGSVDGVSDTWDTGALRGNFNQLKKLKKKYPNIKVLISLGGWSWSSGFSDAALPANRSAFVKSCVDLYIKDSRWAGLFDGIDVDWEYPGACGNTCNFRPEDTQNFTALLAEFRSQLNAAKAGSLLTIAAPAGPDKISKIQVGSIHQYLDFINLMTYDFHGAWETTTNFHSALYNSASNPSKALKFSTDEAVSLWLNGGTPSNKLVVGIPFYGRGWTGVTNASNGVYQKATGAAQGTYEQGIDDYKVLKNKGFQGYYHPDTKAYWIFNGSEFWSYDTPTSIGTKTSYIKSKSLGGGMFWELSGDTSNGELVSAVFNGLQ
ncbi:glycoside hydrolase family 18 protein [Pendulispora brunnea]|uniref:chitinase n=1 Tax=Pendulispora brunnea TaxID=2905690 RepID=A0ABZ2K0I3_9BACT